MILDFKRFFIPTLIIFISIIYSAKIIQKNLNSYDNYSFYQNENHPMIKSSVENHWSEANRIIIDYKSGKKFLESGKLKEDEFLPQKILALYYLITNEDMMKKNIIKADNGKFLYLLLKSFFYFVCVFILFIKIQKKYSSKITVTIISFLCLFPDIFQYQISFWNESYTLIFLLILSLYIIEFKKNIFKNFLFGIFAALPSLTGQEYLFYILIFILYFIFIAFIYKLNPIKYILSFFLGYIFVFSIVIFSNTSKISEQKVNTSGLKSALYIYVTPNILSLEENETIESIKDDMKKDALKWANKNKMTYYDNNELLLNFKNIEDKEIYNNYLLKYSLKKIFKNFDSAITYYLKKTLHMAVLNPMFVSNFYDYSSVQEYLKTENHRENIKFRILYTVLFIFLMLFGFFKSFYVYKPELIFLLSSLIIYNFIILGFLGNARYLAPTLIYMSFFVGSIFAKR